MLRKKREGAYQETLATIKQALDSEQPDSVKLEAIRTAIKHSAAGFIPYIPPPEPELPEAPEKPLTLIEQAALIKEVERLHAENQSLKTDSPPIPHDDNPADIPYFNQGLNFRPTS